LDFDVWASATGAIYTRDVTVRCTFDLLLIWVSKDIARRCRYISISQAPVMFYEIQSTAAFISASLLQAGYS
jgi:hypothetical protein